MIPPTSNSEEEETAKSKKEEKIISERRIIVVNLTESDAIDNNEAFFLRGRCGRRRTGKRKNKSKNGGYISKGRKIERARGKFDT